MRSYEVTYIVDASIDNDSIKATAKKYQDMLTEGGATIVAVNEMGLRQLAYPINRRNSGVYYCVEFQATSAAEVIGKTELQMRRDDAVLRFLTVSLNKFGVKYNADKREGKIGVARKRVKEEVKNERERDNRKGKKTEKKAAPAPKAETPAAPKAEPTPAPVAAAPAPEAPAAAPEKLTKVEGIGPKIAGILNANGVTTFQGLADCTPAQVKEWLTAAEGNFASHNPETWPMQAKLAADGKWDELKEWQDKSDGGKPVVEG